MIIRDILHFMFAIAVMSWLIHIDTNVAHIHNHVVSQCADLDQHYDEAQQRFEDGL